VASARPLNPRIAPLERDPVDLSMEILAEARALPAPDQCARLDRLTAQLHGVSPEWLDGDIVRIAFWANLYNALVLHCLCLTELTGNLLWHLRMFDRIAYSIGGHEYPLNLIEHGILRGNRRPPYRPRRALRGSDERLGAAVSRLDPRIHFALNCGATSCPPIRAYDPEGLEDQLELSTRAYLEAETEVDPARCGVRLPRLMRLYRADFGRRTEQLAFAAKRLPAVRDCVERNRRAVKVGYSRFDWTVAAPPSA
jgi:hypothetical protein